MMMWLMFYRIETKPMNRNPLRLALAGLEINLFFYYIFILIIIFVLTLEKFNLYIVKFMFLRLTRLIQLQKH